MRIAGLHKCSFVDYPGKMAAVVFTPGCNMRCFYCHNRSLIEENTEAAETEDAVLMFLKNRRDFLDGVVVSGGEPTLQKDLPNFLRKVKALGYAVKLDSNGTNPSVLRSVIQEKLVDYIAMDIKAPAEKYSAVTGSRVNTTIISESISAIIGSGADHEFRTTLVPQLSEDDVMAMSRWILGAKRYVLQQYRPIVQGKIPDLRSKEAPHPPEFLRRMAELLNNDLSSPCEIRGVA